MSVVRIGHFLDGRTSRRCKLFHFLKMCTFCKELNENELAY
jgi:hypothetical protein